MGRKPKVAKQLNIMDEDSNRQVSTHPSPSQEASLNTVQSSLMDFLAESLASDDLMFSSLPHLKSETSGKSGAKNDYLNLLDAAESSDIFNIASSSPNAKLRRGEKQLSALLDEK